MHKSLKASAWILGACALVVAAICAHFRDNIRGYYRFKTLCEADGGLRVLHPLKKNAGWLVRKGDYSMAASKYVAFVRYVDGSPHDVHYRSGLLSDENSYVVTPANVDIPVIYELRSIEERLPNEARTSRSGYEVWEIATQTLMVRWYKIGYSTFDQNRTLLAAPSGQACYPDEQFYAPENHSKYFAD